MKKIKLTKYNQKYVESVFEKTYPLEMKTKETLTRFLEIGVKMFNKDFYSIDLKKNYDKSMEMIEKLKKHPYMLLYVLQKQSGDTYKNMTFRNLGLSLKISKCLNKAGITTLDKLYSMSYREISKIKNLDKNDMKEVIELMNKHYLELFDEVGVIAFEELD